MKKNIYLVFMAMILFVSCEEKETILESQVANQEIEKIVIGDVSYDFSFEENELGEVFLKEDNEQSSILINFIEENENTISYFDEITETTYLFRDTEELELFFDEENKKLLSKRDLRGSDFSLAVNRGISTRNISSLYLYRRINFNFLMWTSTTATSSNYSSLNIPDFRHVIFGVTGSTNINDDLSSIKLVSYYIPGPARPVRSTVMIYQSFNYTGYSFVMSVVTGAFRNGGIAETKSFSNLHRKKMFRRWWRTRYWGDRASSMKYWSQSL